MKKNGFTMVELIAVIVIMTLILLIVFPSINSTIKNSEEKKKQETLNNIYMAAENYLLANYDNYNIDNIGDTTYIYITDLINNNYMSIDTLNPNNDSSFSSKDVVKITRQDNGTFSYELDYIKTLIEILLEQYDSSKTTGLLRDSVNENIYYYKGTKEEVANNFLWYGGHQWRVLEFDTSDNTLTLITQQPLTAITPASACWENEEAYNASYINTWLNEYFWNSLDSSVKNNILNSTFNVGIYNDIREITTTKKVGLLDQEQYVRAGYTDSFLDVKDFWWLGNRYNQTHAYFVNALGNFITNNISNNKFGVRPVIKISDFSITFGDGSLENSYSYLNKSSNTNNIQIGEYINVPYNGNDNACGDDKICTFRVINKDSDSIKIILNGLLPNKSEYGNTGIISTSHVIYDSLNKFVNSISNKYLYDSNKIFYIGDYPNASNYKVVQDESLQAKVGLPTIGEMFSSNDIDLGNEKNFVDINTIENPTSSSDYWTMNRYNENSSLVVFDAGYPKILASSEIVGVRPVIYLKNNLTFTGGNGTAQNPYTLD